MSRFKTSILFAYQTYIFSRPVDVYGLFVLGIQKRCEHIVGSWMHHVFKCRTLKMIFFVCCLCNNEKLNKLSLRYFITIQHHKILSLTTITSNSAPCICYTLGAYMLYIYEGLFDPFMFFHLLIINFNGVYALGTLNLLDCTRVQYALFNSNLTLFNSHKL